MNAPRTDKKCGASYIPNTAKCTKGSGVGTAVKAVAAAGAVAGGAYALSRGSKSPGPSSFRVTMTPTTGLKVSRGFAAGVKRHKKAIAAGKARHNKAVQSAVQQGKRRHQAAMLKARRKYEPGFRKRRKLGTFYKDGHAKTGYVRDRLAKIMDGARKPKY